MPSINFVYRLYSQHGRLLYVGVTASPSKRVRVHLYKQWGSDISHHTLTQFESRKEAEYGERYAIFHENPLHNSLMYRTINHKSRKPVPSSMEVDQTSHWAKWISIRDSTPMEALKANGEAIHLSDTKVGRKAKAAALTAIQWDTVKWLWFDGRTKQQAIVGLCNDLWGVELSRSNITNRMKAEAPLLAIE